MALLGLGTDIVEISRIQEHLERSGERLAKRVLTEAEMALFVASGHRERYLAKRFAAKEAVAKALGTGIGRGVSFQHIETYSSDTGAPMVRLTDGARARLDALGATSVHLSIADERHYAVATAIISSD
ncbi:holo-ACP synthase [Shewanella sp. JM162201]|uniref:Holo-[acyl-carrier-protein] synthase n=1 Tax=Shewanella jiangmenensis TaxID=2837387 RepID=A0ABS5V220_9GAMM|nr:holo-ACP synthase [Shewanella jiangmenensis]MBT1444509.1 holo-ACP synthase [Shewanella jiangmenensis]